MLGISAVVACLALPVGCDLDEGPAPTEPAPREIEAANQFGNPEVVRLILTMFDREDELAALLRYGRIRLLSLGQGDAAAIGPALEFLRWTLGRLDAGELSPPGPGRTPAEGVARMFALIFGELGVADFPIRAGALEDGEFVVALVGPAGGKVTVPSRHAAIAFDAGMLSDDTWVVIARLPDPTAPGDCPAGFPPGAVDCYPIFFDFSLFPESNLAGVPRLGQCVVETGPFAPSPTVEARLRIASVDGGSVVFWPLAQAPTTIDCSDLAFGNAPAWWAALDPVWRAFSPSPLYANPGQLGASVSTFSPFAAGDPGTTQTANGQIDVEVIDSQGVPQSGIPVEVFSGQQSVATATTDSDGLVAFAGLPVDPGGSTYTVVASRPNSRATDDDTVTLTPGSPTASVHLVLPSTPLSPFDSPFEIPEDLPDWLDSLF